MGSSRNPGNAKENNYLRKGHNGNWYGPCITFHSCKALKLLVDITNSTYVKPITLKQSHVLSRRWQRNYEDPSTLQKKMNKKYLLQCN